MKCALGGVVSHLDDDPLGRPCVGTQPQQHCQAPYDDADNGHPGQRGERNEADEEPEVGRDAAPGEARDEESAEGRGDRHLAEHERGHPGDEGEQADGEADDGA